MSIICYQCDRSVPQINNRSRCLDCETKRADFNEEENDKLREIAEVSLTRLRRKVEKKSKRIEYLAGRVTDLEAALGRRTMDLESLSKNVEKSVTNALCNVRMIPVIGHKNSKIVEVKDA